MPWGREVDTSFSNLKVEPNLDFFYRAGQEDRARTAKQGVASARKGAKDSFDNARATEAVSTQKAMLTQRKDILTDEIAELERRREDLLSRRAGYQHKALNLSSPSGTRSPTMVGVPTNAPQSNPLQRGTTPYTTPAKTAPAKPDLISPWSY